ncbi:MAG TPA: DNA repair protein RadC [Longimicrobiaceae bacterium]
MATLKESPAADRPRERLMELGAAALASRELLAILVDTGTAGGNGRPARSAIDLAAEMLREFEEEGGGALRRLGAASPSEICRIPGIGVAKAARIAAAFELGRRAAREIRPERERIRNAADVYEQVRLRMRDLRHEEFHVLLLNTQNMVLRHLPITRGTLDASLVHPREVFRAAIAEAAASVIVIHNHPSGDPTPSAEDRVVTRQLVEAGRLVGIEVLDHVVVGEGRYVSFVEAGLMQHSG